MRHCPQGHGHLPACKTWQLRHAGTAYGQMHLDPAHSESHARLTLSWGAQFFVGHPVDEVVNQSMHVLPDATWLEMLRNADLVILNTGHHWHRRDDDFSLYKVSTICACPLKHSGCRGDMPCLHMQGYTCRMHAQSCRND